MSDNAPQLDVPTLLDCCKDYRAQLSEAHECLRDAIELVMKRILLDADGYQMIRRWRKAIEPTFGQGPVVWRNWCSLKAGNDGRRPSGNVWQRTRLNHAVRAGETKSLCNRPVGSLDDNESRHPELPRCRICAKRANMPVGRAP